MSKDQTTTTITYTYGKPGTNNDLLTKEAAIDLARNALSFRIDPQGQIGDMEWGHIIAEYAMDLENKGDQ